MLWGLWEASLGGPLGASGRAPGADFGALDGSWSPWAAALRRYWRLLGGPWGPFGASWAALGAPWAAPKPLSAEKPDFVDSITFSDVFGASESSLLRPSWRLLGGPWGSWVALGRAQWVPGGSWVALASSLNGSGVAAIPNAPGTRSLYR